MKGHCACKSRVVVTGLGVFSPLGRSVEEFWTALKSGKSAVSRLEDTYIAETFPELLEVEKSKVGAFFDSETYNSTIDKKRLKRESLFSIYADLAADLAIKDADLEDNRDDTGVCVGSGIGGLSTIEQQLREYMGAAEKKGISRAVNRKISPFLIPKVIIDAAGGNISVKHGYHATDGSARVSACETGNASIIGAFQNIILGDAKVMVCGGTESAATLLGYAGFANMGALSSNPDPRTASRPFDKERDGFVMGEGAGILVLEDLANAEARGAKIYAEMVSYGCSSDAAGLTKPNEEGTYSAASISQSLSRAGLSPSDLGYINAHGTSTPDNDRTETLAIINTLGDYAEKVSISSTKSMTGHALGAAGALEAIVSILALNDGVIPPTINYSNPDPECNLDYTVNEAIMKDINYAVSNSFGFYGHNSTLCFRKWEP